MRFDEQLESFKQDGTLSAEQVELLRNASRFPLNSSEIVAILGGFFAILGAIWLIGPLFEDVSRLIVVAILYLISGLLVLAFRSLVKNHNSLMLLKSLKLSRCCVSPSQPASP